jgi:hypothetical protein
MFVGSLGRTASAIGRVSVAIFTAVTFVAGAVPPVVAGALQHALVPVALRVDAVVALGTAVVDVAVSAVTQQDEVVVSRREVVECLPVATLSE